MSDQTVIAYSPASPTLLAFHRSRAEARCLIGPVGSGKTSAAAMELGYYLPRWIANKYGECFTRWVVVRNTFDELLSTTKTTMVEWFPTAEWKEQRREMVIRYDPEEGCPHARTVVVRFRSCDNPLDMKKFKSLEITGAWVDESVEVDDSIKLMLKQRCGRFPKKSKAAFFIETSNPPDVEHPIYTNYAWQTHVPGPAQKVPPLEQHLGWWQPAGDNEKNLRPGYYDTLRRAYANNPDWIDLYIKGEPGRRQEGRLVYANFNKKIHVSPVPLKWQMLWAPQGVRPAPLFMGWDNSGNNPAAVLLQRVGPLRFEVLREYQSEKANIVDFTRQVMEGVEFDFPGAREHIRAHYGDPAGGQKYSAADGTMTSNAELMAGVGVTVIPGEQALEARINAVDQGFARIGGLTIDPSCTGLIDGFMAGYVYPEKLGSQGFFLPTPTKNKWSHRQDALQYVMTALTNPATRKRFEDDAHGLAKKEAVVSWDALRE